MGENNQDIQTFSKIEVENNVDWHEKHKLAKVLFSPNVLSREVLCDTGAGFIARETHKTHLGKVPALNVAITNGLMFRKLTAV